jgi:hypothetical protein
VIRSRILSVLAWLIVSIWSRSITIRFVNNETRKQLKAEGKGFIYAFWHGSLFLLLCANRGSGIIIPVSESRDGEIMARLLKRFGFGVVRGSTARNGDKALFRMVSALRKGETIGMAVDGPRGPRHSVKRGVIFLAGRLNVPIIPVVAGAKRSWILNNTWEKLELPVPFTKSIIMFGNPITVRGTSDDAMDFGIRMLEQELRIMKQEVQDLTAAGGERRARTSALTASESQTRKSSTARHSGHQY